MKKVALIIDSSCGIKNGVYENVFVAPIILTEEVDGKHIEYKDGVDINSIELSEKLLKGNNIKTSLANIGETINLIEKISKDYEQIFMMPISDKISSTYEVWKNIAKSEFPDKVKVFNQSTVSGGSQWIIEDIHGKIKDGTLTEEFFSNYLEKIKTNRCCALVVPDLSFLVKGGRVNGIVGAIAQFFSFKILISMDKDGLNYYDRARSEDKILSSMQNMYEKKCDLSHKKIKRLGYISCKNSDKKFEIKDFKQRIKDFFNVDKMEEFEIPPSIMVHVGPNFFAVCIDLDE